MEKDAAERGRCSVSMGGGCISLLYILFFNTKVGVVRLIMRSRAVSGDS